MVAVQAAAEAMLDEPGRALRTVEAMAAGAAQRQRRVAAPVEEQQRLLLAASVSVHRVDQQRRQPFAALRRVFAQVDGVDVGQFDAGEAARQDEMAIAARARVDVAFDRRRGGGEHDGQLAEVGAHDGHVARLVVDAIVLLEALVVLLVDDDEAEFA